MRALPSKVPLVSSARRRCDLPSNLRMIHVDAALSRRDTTAEGVSKARYSPIPGTLALRAQGGGGPRGATHAVLPHTRR